MGEQRNLSEIRQQFRDSSLSLLLGVQCVIIFGIGPLIWYGIEVSTTLAGFVLLIVIFAVVLAARRLTAMLAVIAALLVNATAAVLLRVTPTNKAIFWMDGIGSMLSIFGLSWVVVEVVFAPGRVDRHRIIGAVVLYLNFALLFEALFRMISELYPGAFNGLPPSTDRIRSISDLMYLSMTTLTTVGYGDISPVHPLARSLANMEGLVGQLYPAIILARIMTLYSSRR